MWFLLSNFRVILTLSTTNMKTITTILILLFIYLTGESASNPYPKKSERIVSPGKTIYYIDPKHGDDSNSGTSKSNAWRTFHPANQLIFSPGDKLNVVTPGAFDVSLFLMAEGTKKNPVTVSFAEGTYDFFPDGAVKRKFNISNTNDMPDSLKAIAFYFLESKNVVFNGSNSLVRFRGKVIETCVDNCENISISNIRFDYFRPTVSEMTITEVSENFAIAKIHPDSWFDVKDSTLTWFGEGWSYNAPDYWQIYDPVQQKVWRNYLPISQLKFSKVDDKHICIYFKNNPAFREGLVFQTRDVRRDYAAFFTQRSKNIKWKNIDVYFMHGMGFVSQFTENICFDSVKISPSPNSGRTCAAWADVLHFSGCRGNIEVKDCFLSAANDDAINVHGTHLRVLEKTGENQIKVRFMHSQAYGFAPFVAGDSIAFVDEESLLPYQDNLVTNVQTLSEKEFLLDLSRPVPINLTENDVVENTTWAPDVHISGTTSTNIPTRGFLISTRGKVVIENNKFIRTLMCGILIADDARSWFESGVVRDVTIRNNVFLNCGGPVINIHPETEKIIPNEFVHKNIVIEGNQFVVDKELVLFAKSTSGIKFRNNEIETNSEWKMTDRVRFEECSDVINERNKLNK